MDTQSQNQNTQNQITKGEEYLKPLEAAEYMRLKKITLDQWRSKYNRTGELSGPPFIRVNKLILYRRSDIDKYLESKVVRAFTKD